MDVFETFRQILQSWHLVPCHRDYDNDSEVEGLAREGNLKHYHALDGAVSRCRRWNSNLPAGSSKGCSVETRESVYTCECTLVVL